MGVNLSYNSVFTSCLSFEHVVLFECQNSHLKM